MKENMLDFYQGMDISFLPQHLDQGVRMRDMDGTEAEPFALIKKYGVNAIRLRIWNNPENVKESGGYCSLEHTLKMAKQIRKNGMRFLLDFHYSDFWADPANQRKPKEWENLSREQLKEAVYQYTRDILLALDAQETLPDMVQIGNEIRSGLLFPEGELPDYRGMTELINAGIRGARAVAGPERMQVMIHLDQGGRYDWLHSWFEGAFAQGLQDFDLIGLSYYPFWHGTYMDLRNSMMRLIDDYGKPILIVETAYAWRESKTGFIDSEQIRLGGFPATPEGQRRVLETVMHLVASLPDKMGRGVYYWEPLCVPRPGKGGWEENMGLLDEDGRIMEGILSFGQSREQMEQEPKGFQELTSIQEGADHGPVEHQGENLLKNGDFSRGLEEWQVDTEEETAEVALTPAYEEGQEIRSRILRISSQKNFRFMLSQQVALKKNGVFSLWAELQGVDTTGVDVRLFVESGKECRETVIHPSEHAWTLYEVRDVDCEAGMVRVGLKISAPPLYVSVRNFSFIER